MTSIRLLKSLPTKDLQDRFLAAFGKPTPSRNRPWLIKRLAAAPTPTEPAPASADATAAAQPSTPALVPDAAPVPTPARQDPPADTATTAALTPPVGAEIRKTWRGQELVVTVQADGFLLGGTTYRSLSAAATALCGGNRNGLVFFGLKPRPGKVGSATP